MESVMKKAPKETSTNLEEIQQCIQLTRSFRDRSKLAQDILNQCSKALEEEEKIPERSDEFSKKLKFQGSTASSLIIINKGLPIMWPMKETPQSTCSQPQVSRAPNSCEHSTAEGLKSINGANIAKEKSLDPGSTSDKLKDINSHHDTPMEVDTQPDDGLAFQNVAKEVGDGRIQGARMDDKSLESSLVNPDPMESELKSDNFQREGETAIKMDSESTRNSDNQVEETMNQDTIIVNNDPSSSSQSSTQSIEKKSSKLSDFAIPSNHIVLQNVVFAQVQTQSTDCEAILKEANFEAEFIDRANFEELNNVSIDSCSMDAKENLTYDEPRLKNESILPQMILDEGNMQIDEPQNELSSEAIETPYVHEDIPKNNVRVNENVVHDPRDDLGTSKQEDISDLHPFFKKPRLGGMFDKYPLVSLFDIFS